MENATNAKIRILEQFGKVTVEKTGMFNERKLFANFAKPLPTSSAPSLNIKNFTVENRGKFLAKVQAVGIAVPDWFNVRSNSRDIDALFKMKNNLNETRFIKCSEKFIEQAIEDGWTLLPSLDEWKKLVKDATKKKTEASKTLRSALTKPEAWRAVEYAQDIPKTLTYPVNGAMKYKLTYLSAPPDDIIVSHIHEFTVSVRTTLLKNHLQKSMLSSASEYFNIVIRHDDKDGYSIVKENFPSIYSSSKDALPFNLKFDGRWGEDPLELLNKVEVLEGKDIFVKTFQEAQKAFAQIKTWYEELHKLVYPNDHVETVKESEPEQLPY